MGRECELCGINIEHKIKSARYCSRSHKEKHYRYLNREKVRIWRRNNQKKHLSSILEKRKIKEAEEKKEFGFSKKYLREYAKRHKKDLIMLKKEVCFKCNTKRNLIIHHTKYTKDPKDWEFVCKDCHNLIHEPTTLL